MRAMSRKFAKRKAITPATPKKACTPKTIKKDSRLFLPVVMTELRAPIKMRNAPSRPIIVITWSSRKDFHENENVRRGLRSCTVTTGAGAAEVAAGTTTGPILADGGIGVPALPRVGGCVATCSTFFFTCEVGKAEGTATGRGWGGGVACGWRCTNSAPALNLRR